jgi:ribosomal protein S18 acetylase RimI-like enzyme
VSKTHVGKETSLAKKRTPKPPFDIRPYRISDERSVVALWREVFPDDPPHHDPVACIHLKVSEQPELFFVATRGGKVVGTIMAGFDGHRGWIYRVAVSPKQQRQGIGTALMRRAETELIARGAPKINLQVRATNGQVASFYEQLGFVVEERISMGKRIK